MQYQLSLSVEEKKVQAVMDGLCPRCLINDDKEVQVKGLTHCPVCGLKTKPIE